MRKLFFTIFVFQAIMLCTSGMVQAAKITLKNGKVIEAPILERETYLIRVKIDGVPQHIYMGEIESIEEDVFVSEVEESITPEDSERKRELILRLLEANLSQESMQRSFWQIIEQAPPEQQHNLRKLLNVHDVMEQLVPVYAEFYTELEVEDLLTFYNSPSGRKMLKTAPDLLRKTTEVMGDYFKALEGGGQGTGQKPLPRGGNPLSPR